jgi:hypothetical protein
VVNEGRVAGILPTDASVDDFGLLMMGFVRDEDKD